MQDYASYAIVFFSGSVKKWLKLGEKTDNLAHFGSFFVDALLHPINYAPRFYRLKYLIKIHIRVKFQQYSVCGCEVKNFQRFSIHEI